MCAYIYGRSINLIEINYYLKMESFCKTIHLTHETNFDLPPNNLFGFKVLIIIIFNSLQFEFKNFSQIYHGGNLGINTSKLKQLTKSKYSALIVEDF